MLTLEQLILITPFDEERSARLLRRLQDMPPSYRLIQERILPRECWDRIRNDFWSKYFRRQKDYPPSDWDSLALAIKAEYIIKLVVAGERVSDCMTEINSHLYPKSNPELSHAYRIMHKHKEEQGGKIGFFWQPQQNHNRYNGSRKNKLYSAGSSGQYSER